LKLIFVGARALMIAAFQVQGQLTDARCGSE